jgi:hypothetical protein
VGYSVNGPKKSSLQQEACFAAKGVFASKAAGAGLPKVKSVGLFAPPLVVLY